MTDYLNSQLIIRAISPNDQLNAFKSGSKNFQPLKAFLQNQALEFQ